MRVRVNLGTRKTLREALSSFTLLSCSARFINPARASLLVPNGQKQLWRRMHVARRVGALLELLLKSCDLGLKKLSVLIGALSQLFFQLNIAGLVFAEALVQL